MEVCALGVLAIVGVGTIIVVLLGWSWLVGRGREDQIVRAEYVMFHQYSELVAREVPRWLRKCRKKQLGDEKRRLEVDRVELERRLQDEDLPDEEDEPSDEDDDDEFLRKAGKWTRPKVVERLAYTKKVLEQLEGLKKEEDDNIRLQVRPERFPGDLEGYLYPPVPWSCIEKKATKWAMKAVPNIPLGKAEAIARHGIIRYFSDYGCQRSFVIKAESLHTGRDVSYQNYGEKLIDEANLVWDSMIENYHEEYSKRLEELEDKARQSEHGASNI